MIRSYDDWKLDTPDEYSHSQDNLPDDYERCGDCGYDHSYEYEQAYQSHQDDILQLKNSQFFQSTENTADHECEMVHIQLDDRNDPPPLT